MKKQAEWIILAYMWEQARFRNLNILGMDPGYVWCHSECLSICPMRIIRGSSKLDRACPSYDRGLWCGIVPISVI
ncbi:hypothetical protein TSTA_016260 [Talaromyces stipitatus ATCC 10500]|uniref:Uncharacterized protein n=1 Tax=Talaromyces stipitatus (strain ATCC 10500 / CBS 375.48 / QM 6759 / NRRL 1006) TaxID=441959 RepID=B8MEC0_TALSN|nr:uncharacterized protein TSTA_016260 [Talaromyces stipitatus ATCC 10500]EED16547.1 hypothetical protein TSTA_016260 [Talaromyces stipitatus ATCC 10500]